MDVAPQLVYYVPMATEVDDGMGKLQHLGSMMLTVFWILTYDLYDVYITCWWFISDSNCYTLFCGFSSVDIDCFQPHSNEMRWVNIKARSVGNAIKHYDTQIGEVKNEIFVGTPGSNAQVLKFAWMLGGTCPGYQRLFDDLFFKVPQDANCSEEKCTNPTCRSIHLCLYSLYPMFGCVWATSIMPIHMLRLQAS